MELADQNQATTSSPKPKVDEPLYLGLKNGVVRLPLLPIETYKKLFDPDSPARFRTDSSGRSDWQHDIELLANPQVRLALAAGSASFYESLERDAAGQSSQRGDAKKLKQSRGLCRTLMRYLIRMTTRPTPYGLFAGVGLVDFSDRTSLFIEETAGGRSSRPDMGVIRTFVKSLEKDSDIRHQLKLVSNPAAFERLGRIVVHGTRVLQIDGTDKEVTAKSTSLVKKVMEAARSPICYRDLESQLVNTNGVTAAEVERLLTDLWQQEILLTDLPPSITGDLPANALLKRLYELEGIEQPAGGLDALLKCLESADAKAVEEAIPEYRRACQLATRLADPGQGDPIQMDAKAELSSGQISESVAKEAARAAELLLRMSPHPTGSPTTGAYRRLFVSRYGEGREVPLLHLLDPNIGLGPYSIQILNTTEKSGNFHRNNSLAEIAFRASRQGEREVHLDEDTLRKLETWSPENSIAPTSLDINVLVAASSKEAIDRGDFRLVVGPNVGASAAGRNLGRFAHLLGKPAENVLNEIARLEERVEPETLAVELVYPAPEGGPRNVSIRPRIRDLELRVGIPVPSDDANQIRLDEILVGVHNNRFYLHCPRLNSDLRITAGHMLNPWLGPDICTFLSDASRDGEPHFAGFNWGQAEAFPFLPRIRSGKIVLRPAEWKISESNSATDLPHEDRQGFANSFLQWRAMWKVPRYVFLAQADNRLLLDTNNEDHVEELRLEMKRLRPRERLVLQEALPSPQELWSIGPGGKYYSEITVPLILNANERANLPRLSRPQVAQRKSGSSTKINTDLQDSDHQKTGEIRFPDTTIRKFPPGSPWLYVKFYCGRDFLEDFVVEQFPAIIEPLVKDGVVDKWFFIRYSDPDPHLRVRLHGQPNGLLAQALPHISELVQPLVSQGICQRFSIDTYEPEVERYGGPQAIGIAEDIFCADSVAVLQFLQALRDSGTGISIQDFAVLSVDVLLANLLPDEQSRLDWIDAYATKSTNCSAEFRSKKDFFRQLLADRELEPKKLQTEFQGAIETMGVSVRRAASRLKLLAHQEELERPASEIIRALVHIHCNRLMGINYYAEVRVLELLKRTRKSLAAAPGPSR